MVSINLIPPDVVFRHALRRRFKIWTLAILGSAALTTIPLGVDWFHEARTDDLRQQAAQLRAELVRLRESVRQTRAQSVAAQAELDRARALRGKRAWSSVFQLLADCLPPDAWLTSVATDPPSPASSAARNPRPTGLPLGLASKLKKNNKEEAPPVQSMITIEAPRAFVLRGYAVNDRDLYEFMARLKRHGAFDNVRLVRAGYEPVLERTAVGFELVCSW